MFEDSIYKIPASKVRLEACTLTLYTTKSLDISTLNPRTFESAAFEDMRTNNNIKFPARARRCQIQIILKGGKKGKNRRKGSLSNKWIDKHFPPFCLSPALYLPIVILREAPEKFSFQLSSGSGLPNMGDHTMLFWSFSNVEGHECFDFWRFLKI